MTEARQPTTRDKTTNCSQYNAALKARSSLSVWLPARHAVVGYTHRQTRPSANIFRCQHPVLFEHQVLVQPALAPNVQVVELQVRVALLNRFTELGTPVTVTVA